jgi:hypothetical protein
MKKKGVVIVVALFLLLFLTACTRVPGGENSRDTATLLQQVQSGSEGVYLEIEANYPPATIYDQNELLSVIDVHNRGNFDLERQDCFVQITGFDPNIIRGGFGIPQPCTSNFGTLEGKNIYNIEGSRNQLEFTSAAIQLPKGVLEYNPTLNYVTCYNYETKANPLVCIDPLFYQVTAEQKTCQPRDVGLGGGQGAPVAVTHVGVDMVGKNKAVFDITVENLGGGTVLSPDAGIQNCADASLGREDLNKLRYDIRLSGANPVSCKPLNGVVRLNNDRGKIVCTFSIPGTLSYETPLQINLQYSYIDSQTKNVRIIKTPG